MVRAEVSRIRESRFFQHSARLAAFLSFTVEKTLAGRSDELKEYLIGVEVYGRREGFDPKGDSIVRSEAVRLRHRLRQYYEVEGAQNTLRISFPKGVPPGTGTDRAAATLRRQPASGGHQREDAERLFGPC